MNKLVMVLPVCDKDKYVSLVRNPYPFLSVYSPDKLVWE